MRANRAPANMTLSGHWHNPKFDFDEWQQQGLYVLPALKFHGEKFGRYCDPTKAMKVGFLTFDFEEGNPKPIMEVHPINLSIMKEADKDEIC